MVSNEREQIQRFENLILEFCGGVYNIPCHKCPIQKQCEESMKDVKTEDELNNCHTCEETLWHYIKTGEFLK